MFQNDSGKGTQRFIGFSRAWERSGHIRFQHHYRASRSIPRCVLVGRSAAEIILRKNLAGISLTSGLAFTR